MNDRDEADLIKKRGFLWEQFDDPKSLVLQKKKCKCSKKARRKQRTLQHENHRNRENTKRSEKTTGNVGLEIERLALGRKCARTDFRDQPSAQESRRVA